MRIAISAESTIDIPVEMQKEFDIHTVPFTVFKTSNPSAPFT